MNTRHILRYIEGVTLIEVMVSMAILVMVGLLVGRFQGDIFSFANTIQNGYSADEQARAIIRPMSNEIRSASPSSLGAYPIVLASSTTFTFYSDLNNDGLKEEVRYFVSGGALKKGVITPTGNPYVYNTSSEVITTIVSNLTNGNSTTTPVFQYFGDSYTGTSSSLTQPVSPLLVRIVKINFGINVDPGRSPGTRLVTTQVEIRSLKDNL